MLRPQAQPHVRTCADFGGRLLDGRFVLWTCGGAQAFRTWNIGGRVSGGRPDKACTNRLQGPSLREFRYGVYVTDRGNLGDTHLAPRSAIVPEGDAGAVAHEPEHELRDV